MPASHTPRIPSLQSGTLTLSLRFTLVATGVLVLAVVGVSFMYEHARGIASEAGRRENLRLHARRAADEFHHQLEVLTGDALFLARTPPLLQLRRTRENDGPTDAAERAECYDHLRQLFFSLAYARPWYFQVRLIGIEGEGRELVRIERQDGKVVATPPQALQPKGHRYYVQEALGLAEGRVWLSHVDLNREHGRISLPETVTLRAVTPVMDSADRPFALVVINLDMQRVFDHMAQLVPAGDPLYLANQEGWFLYHPDPGRAMGFDRARSYGLAQAFPRAAARFAGIEPGTGLFFDANTPAGPLPAYATRRVIDNTGASPRHLTLVLADGTSATDRELDAARREGYLAIGLLIGSATLLVAFLNRALTRSLRVLVKASAAVTRGDYAVRIPRSSIGDLDQLTRAFHHMSSSLQDREARLQALNRTLEQRVTRRTGELEVSRAELVRERGLMQSIIDHIGDGVVAVDSTGRFLLWNGRAEAMLGMGPADVPVADWSGHYGVLRSPAGEPLPVQELPLVRALGGETVRSQEVFVRNACNAPGHWIAVDAQPVTGASGSPEGAVAVLVNRDDARRQQEARDVRSGELARIGRLTLIGQIVDTTAHRLSQPLATIANYAGAAMHLLASGRLDTPQLEEILGHINRAAERGGETLDALRGLTRRSQLSRGPVDLNAVVVSALELLSDRLQRQQVQVERRLDPELPAVYGQEMELQQVLIHLVINAMESLAGTDDSRRYLCITSEFDSASRRVRIRVEDSGPGVATDVAERIFEPCFSTRVDALGLGLAVVRNILEHHDGSVSLERDEQGMTRFVIELPAGERTDD